jgi:hypothetical protein
MKALVILTSLVVIAGVLHWVLRGLWKAASYSGTVALVLFISLANMDRNTAVLVTYALVWMSATAISIVPGVFLRLKWPEHFRDYDRKTQSSPSFGLRSRIAGAVAMLLGGEILWFSVTQGYGVDEWKIFVGGIASLALGAYYLITGNRAVTPQQFILEGKLHVDGTEKTSNEAR